MEEADAFIKEACKHINCSFGDDENIEFTTPQIFEFIVRCIWKIDNSSKTLLPSYVYPKEITTRLHLGNAISNNLQKLQIRGDIALHTVLYGNINNLRSAFIELIRKLPADLQDKVDEERDAAFFGKVSSLLESEPEWVPPFLRGVNEKGGWMPADNSPELFPFGMSNKPTVKFDPRGWICQYLSSTTTGERPVSADRGRPALPPKPSFIKTTEDSIEKVPVLNDNTEALLHAEYEEKLIEYRNLEQIRYKMEVENDRLTTKLAQFEPEFIEALKNPDVYAEKLLSKISELNNQIENNTLRIQLNRKEAALTRQAMAAEMAKMGVRGEESGESDGIKGSLAKLEEQIDDTYILKDKLKGRIRKAEGSENFYEYEKRSRELDEMVRKQEDDMIRMQEERLALRKQEERENEAVNRSFSIIYNILLQHCDHYRGRLAMESFTRIHLYCMEIMEMLRGNGTLKKCVNSLESEIYLEDQKQYGKKCDLLNNDLQEVSALNEELVSSIKALHPTFKAPSA